MYSGPHQLIHLNVGGRRFSTSHSTLDWCPDTFFSALLSGRIPVLRDDKDAIFIDRDPKLFSIILNYLRTKQIDLKQVDITILRHEAEFYNIQPLVRRLLLCEDMQESFCGGLLFYGYLPATVQPESSKTDNIEDKQNSKTVISGIHTNTNSNVFLQSSAPRPGQIVRTEVLPSRNISLHTRTSSWDFKVSSTTSRKDHRHHRNQSADFNKYINNDLQGTWNSCNSDNPAVKYDAVNLIKAHHNCVAIAHSHYITVFQLKEAIGWQLTFTSPYINNTIERLSINAKFNLINADQPFSKLIAISYKSYLRLWSLTQNHSGTDIGVFNLTVNVEQLFFINTQIVALSVSGKIGVWHALTQHFQVQDLGSNILSFDSAGSFLLLGAKSGKIYIVDMQKFPLRMKDNDLLVTELYKDPASDEITALSVYLTPKTSSLQGNWIEIAYGTKNGVVRVVVQHPETAAGQGPQLFQTFSVHTSPIVRITLSEKYLISVCNEYNHVRTWKVTRFRGMISTQPGSSPVASYKLSELVSLEATENYASYAAGNDFGPYGDQDDDQIFIQKIIPETDQIYVRLASDGSRVCVIKSVDGSLINAFTVHECEGNLRLLGSRPRRFILTGHKNGTVQLWDLSTALESATRLGAQQISEGGPSKDDLMKILDQCDLSNSRTSFLPPTLLVHSRSNSFNLYLSKLNTSNLASFD